MKLSYAKAAVFTMASSSVFQASTCSYDRLPEPRTPAIETPQRPAKKESPPTGPELQEKAPDGPQEDNPDGGPPPRRERPGPHDPLGDELHTRLAMRQ
jgi:hypothetical protein